MTDPYASHLPVLDLLLGTVRPVNVLELGAGKHSTLRLLSAPSVARVVSVEEDPAWWAYVYDLADRANRLDRLDLRDRRPPIVSPFDLVLIDNGRNVEERLGGIHYVLGTFAPAVVVIHDSDVAEYSKAIEEYRQFYDVVRIPTEPETAVLWI